MTDVMNTTTAKFTVVAVALIVFGLIFNYVAFPFSESSSIERTDTSSASFSVDIGFTSSISAVSTYTSTSYDITSYRIFVDDRYAGYYTSEETSGSAEWIIRNAAKYGLTITTINADELRTVMECGNISTAIIVISGILPDTVYVGNPSDPIFEWLKNGGILYWSGGPIGRYTSSSEGNVIDLGKKDDLFLGNHASAPGYGYEERDEGKNGDRTFGYGIVSGSLTECTAAYLNECTFGTDTTILTSPYLALDFKYKGYSAVTFCKYHDGDGMVCVYGGNVEKDNSTSFVHLIASNLRYDSVLVDYKHVDKGSHYSGTIGVYSAPTTVFIYLTPLNAQYGQSKLV